MNAVLQNIREFWTRTFVFDANDQSLFLTVIAAQLQGRRTPQAIFTDLQFDDNKHIQKLSRDALDPNQPFFFAGTRNYLGKENRDLLVLAQHFNCIEPFITHIVGHKKPYSFFGSIFLKYVIEWFMVALFIGLALAMVWYIDFLRFAFGDFSGSILYRIGEFLINWQFALYGLTAILMIIYYRNRDRETPFRNELKKFGCYHFYDADYIIKLMTTFHLLSDSSTHTGVTINNTELVRQLIRIYAKTPLRAEQFRRMQKALAAGLSLRDALAQSRILPSLEMSLYRGLTPHNTLPEHAAASLLVAKQLSEKTRIRLNRFSQSLGALLYSLLAIGMLALLDVLAGGAVSIQDLMNQQLG